MTSNSQFHGRGVMPRTNKKAFAIVLLLAAAISLSIYGCGGVPRPGFLTSGSTSVPTPTPAPTPTPTPNPVPVAVSLSPNTTTAQGPAFTLTVNGSNFLQASVVEWNGSSRSTTFVNSGQLTAQIAASDVATAGQVAVTVFNPAPGGGTSGPMVFTILAPNPVPVAASLSPNMVTEPGPAFTLKVKGSNFVSASVVEWNGSSRVTTFINSGQLTAQIGASDVATNGQAAITVSNPSPGGGTSGPLIFAILAPIAFSSNRALDSSNASTQIHNIWLTQGFDAVPLTGLTVLGADSFDPVWSASGFKLAFTSSRALDKSNNTNTNNDPNIWGMNFDGSGVTPLTNFTASVTGGLKLSPAVWSSDNNRIAFSALAGVFGSNIIVMNADGSAVVHITSLTALKNIEPTWSPFKDKVAFASTRALDGTNSANTNNTLNIWVANSDGSGVATPLTQLTALNADGFSPVWLLDGTILFCSTRALNGSNSANVNNTSNIWVMNSDGTGATPLTRLTAPGADNLFPTLSQDGSKIVFQSRRALDGTDRTNTNSVRNIWVMNVDGSAATPLTRLTALGTDTFSPTWMTGGDRIAYAANNALDGSNAVNANGTENLWIVNLDGTGLVPLTSLTATGVDVEELMGQP